MDTETTGSHRSLKPLEPRRRQGEKGFVMYLMAAGAFAMIALAGLSVDVGYLQWQKRRVQSAADAAALAASKVATTDGCTAVTSASCAPAFVAAKAVAALNGFTDSTYSNTNPNATVSLTDTSSGSTHSVQAVVSYTAPVYFMHVFGTNSINVSAGAVAGFGSASGGGVTSITGSNCIYELNTSNSLPNGVQGAIFFTGSETITASCGMVTNSTFKSGFGLNGSANVTATAYNLAASSATGYYVSGATLNGPAPNYGQTPPGDPLSSLTAPVASNYSIPTGISSSAQTYRDNNSSVSSATFSPGIYCGGIKINGAPPSSTGATKWTLSAGMYIMAGGGFTVQNGTVDATAGVTIYNTSSTFSSACTGSSAFAPILIQGSTVTYSQNAPTSQASTPGNTSGITGVAFFQDRSAGTTTQQNTFNGNAVVTINGALYFKNSQLLVSGVNSTTTGYLILVADTVDVNGSSPMTIKANYSSLTGGQGIAVGSTSAPLTLTQ